MLGFVLLLLLLINDGELFGLFDTEDEMDVVIAVKTTRRYHETRLGDIIDTWWQLAPRNVFFFSDGDDAHLNATVSGHMINTECPSTHSRQALSCKLTVELRFALAANRSWMCHFDDDNYVNVVQLIKVLRGFDPSRDWYLGKPSTRGPVDIEDGTERVHFWFATGGAGFCLSRSLLRKMQPYIERGRFEALADRLKLPDDVALGYLIEHLLQRRLTVIDRFHSHLESLSYLSLDQLTRQVSVSGGSYNRTRANVVGVPQRFTDDEDPMRFRSLHCFLFSAGCPR